MRSTVYNKVRAVGLAVTLAALVACAPAANRPSIAPAAYLRPQADPCPASASLQTGPSSAAWYVSVAPSEHFNSERTHVFPSTCTPQEIVGSSPVGVAVRRAPGDYPSPYNIVTRGRDELFVYGGAYGDQPNATGSYVARLDPLTLQSVWRTQLIDARAEKRWNYPGVIAVHGNGLVYAIYGDRLAKLDPANGKIIQQVTLPSPKGAEARDVSYNGFTVLSDGTIVAKSIGRGRCDLEGFTALLQCPQDKFPAAVLVTVNPDTLEVVSSLELPEPAFGRITSTRYRGQQYVYLAGSRNLLRYVWRDGKLALDPSWGPVAYLRPGQTPASAIGMIGDFVALQTNAAPAQTPLSVVAVSQVDSARVFELQPFKDVFSFTSFLPSMISVDPENNRIYAQDSGPGQLAAIDMTEGGLKLAWRAPQRTLSFTTLIGGAKNRVIVGTDIPDVRTPRDLQGFTREQVVWREAATGAEIARSPDLEPLTSGALVTPGFHGVMYYPVLKGGLVELSFSGSLERP
jgi:hypothetical protein